MKADEKKWPVTKSAAKSDEEGNLSQRVLENRGIDDKLVVLEAKLVVQFGVLIGYSVRIYDIIYIHIHI